MWSQNSAYSSVARREFVDISTCGEKAFEPVIATARNAELANDLIASISDQAEQDGRKRVSPNWAVEAQNENRPAPPHFCDPHRKPRRLSRY